MLKKKLKFNQNDAKIIQWMCLKEEENESIPWINMDCRKQQIETAPLTAVVLIVSNVDQHNDC